MSAKWSSSFIFRKKMVLRSSDERKDRKDGFQAHRLSVNRLRCRNESNLPPVLKARYTYCTHTAAGTGTVRRRRDTTVSLLHFALGKPSKIGGTSRFYNRWTRKQLYHFIEAYSDL
jgi:hypothetical protein